MAKSALRQFGDLSLADFERHPVWIGCHTADYDEPWYDETDDETFRPWNGALPATLTEGMLLVRAEIELRDGSRHQGFVTPAFENGDLGTQQPHVFLDDRPFGFWGGAIGVPIEKRRKFYAALRRTGEEVFPLRFCAGPGLAIGIVSGQIQGFYQSTTDGVTVER